jgi:hypothetical protein
MKTNKQYEQQCSLFCEDQQGQHCAGSVLGGTVKRTPQHHQARKFQGAKHGFAPVLVTEYECSS